MHLGVLQGGWLRPPFFLCSLALSYPFYSASVFAACDPPSNWPVGLIATCQCDDFARSTLNPSPIYGGNWLVTASDTTGLLPRIVTNGRLQLTAATGNNGKAATAPGFFPGAGNYISVEFNHYAYGGNGADGMAVILSDYAVPPQPGATGGSLGYANKTGVPGFAGGWIGIALDEFGNFQDPGEGRLGGPARTPDSVSVRGSGSGTTGYPWLAGTGSLPSASPIDKPSPNTNPLPGYRYQVIIDARTYTATNKVANFAVNRDLSGTGATYTNVFPSFEVYSKAASLGRTQAAVPENWQVSLTGSTGGSTNIHEIGALKICASSYFAPGFTGQAAGFNAIDSSYARGDVNALTGHLFTKLAGTPFALNIAALKANASGIEQSFVLSGTKTVVASLVDDSAGTSCNASPSACTACSKPVIATQSVVFSNSDKGFKKTGNFSVSGAYKKVLVRMTEGATVACSTDTFAIRPTGIDSVTTTATNTGSSGNPVFKAGVDAFTLTATVSTSGYTGSLSIDPAKIEAMPSGLTAGQLTAVGTTSSAALPGGSQLSQQFTYSEVGGVRIQSGGVRDETWTQNDQGAQGDCVAGSSSNTADASGKFGCLVATTTNSVVMGRFVPSQFEVVSGSGVVTPACTSGFTYMDQPFRLQTKIEARNGAGVITRNYDNSNVSNFATVNWTAENADDGIDLSSRLNVPAPTKLWANGVYDLDSSSVTFSRGTAGPDGAFDALQLGVRISDPEGASLANRDINPATTGVCSGAICAARAIGSQQVIRHGRLRLSNRYGSEKMDLLLPVQAEYWTGKSWAINALDSCTTLAANSFALSGDISGNISASAVSLMAGLGNLRLLKPTPVTTGSVDIAVHLGSTGSDQSCLAAHGGTGAQKPWLRSRNGSCASTYDRDPAARATFGIFSPETRKKVLTRELF